MSNLYPWEPVKTKETATGQEVSLWGRKYTFDEKTPLLSSVVSNGIELLADKMTVIAEENGVPCNFGDAVIRVIDEGEERQTVVLACESETVVLNTCFRIEYDGCMDASITVAPKGNSIASFFGMDKARDNKFSLEKLTMEIPLKKSAVRYYHIYPIGGINGKPAVAGNGNLDYAGFIPDEGIHCGFKEQVYLGGDDCGLGVFFESNKHWVNKDKDRVFEVINEPDRYVLRIKFLEDEPKKWVFKGEDNQFQWDLDPISFNFGIQVTPVKPFPENPYVEKNFHVDCCKKVEGNYEDFFSNPVVEGDTEIGFDRIKRLGVNTLYIHEKWNDMQNSHILTTKTADRLKYIIEECHKRGIRVIPYFGYEISSLSPLWAKKGEEYAMGDVTANEEGLNWKWYRFPYQRDPRICPNSSWADDFYEGVKGLMEKFNFDGLYFDSVVSPWSGCINEKHGCGWRDENGKLHPTFPVWAIRRLFKKLYNLCESRGATMHIHGSGSFNMAAIAFYHSIWEGEQFQGLLMNGKLKSMPEGHFRAQYTGRDTGVPVFSLCYSAPPVWTFKNASAICLIHGSLPKPVDIGEPLEDMSKIWKAIDAFPISEATWHPYYKEHSDAVSDNEEVKVSYYKAGNKMLIFCASVHADFEGRAKIKTEYKNVKNALTGEMMSDKGELTLDFKGFDYVVLTAEE